MNPPGRGYSAAAGLQANQLRLVNCLNRPSSDAPKVVWRFRAVTERPIFWRLSHAGRRPLSLLHPAYIQSLNMHGKHEMCNMGAALRLEPVGEHQGPPGAAGQTAQGERGLARGILQPSNCWPGHTVRPIFSGVSETKSLPEQSGTTDAQAWRRWTEHTGCPPIAGCRVDPSSRGPAARLHARGSRRGTEWIWRSGQDPQMADGCGVI
jgi:hypothetical protein